MNSHSMTRRGFLKAVGLAAASAAVGAAAPRSAAAAASGGRANIILMMADDMGFSDIGCYGGEIRTPNLNSLADNGVRFTQFYNTARCCPTRASLMTGLYQHQAGIGHMMDDKGYESYQGDLNNRCVTIAQVMKSAGYRTYMAGKWHVTRYRYPEGPKHNWPRQRGFDRFFGTIHGAGSFYDPNSLTRDNTMIPPGENFYYTNAIADNAVQYILDHKKDHKDKPFFMYVAFTCPHWPMHALPEDIARYKGRYDGGWDKLRAERRQRMVKLGVIKRRWKLTERDPGVPAWEDAPDKQWFARRMEVYAAMVDRMDQNIGRIIETLKKTGDFDNTLFLFLADNGGCAEEYGSRGKVKPDPSKPVELKPMKPDELQMDMQPKVTRDGKPVRTGYGVMPGPADTYIAYGKPWANASNTPFRLYKHWVHEGGISTPLIAHWPDKIKDKGELRNEPGHLIDIMATCVDVAGADYPTEYKGNRIIPAQGKSLLPVFLGGSLDKREIYWEHEGNRAVRQGRWKLVSRHPGKWELYDMQVDRTELNDLAETYPDKVKQLASLYEAWAKRCGVQPWPVTKKQPNKA